MILMNLKKTIEVYSGTELKAEITADIQPYSGGLAQEEYGLEIETVKRIYCEPCTFLEEGARVALKGENLSYTVKYAEHWDDYTMALLNKLPTAVKDESVNVKTGENGASDIYGGGFY